MRLFVTIAFLFLLPPLTSAATLELSPVGSTVSVNSTITETVLVSSINQAMNAISGTISFPTNLLQVVSVSRTNSILSLWVQEPVFSNTNGTISFSGIVPNPGYTGSRSQVFSIQFRGKKEGTATVLFSPSPQVLANDGNGTDILTGTNAATITVVAATPQSPPPAPSSTGGADLLARITSSTHPDQTKWYKLSHAIFDWTNAQGVSAVRLGYDKNADGNPSVLYSDPLSHKELDLDDGIWYFHVQQRGPNGWGPISTYRIQIDTVPPLPFTITFPNGTTTPFGSTIATQFATTDGLSGIDRYQIVVDGKEFVATTDDKSRAYTVSGDSGTHILLVRAYDKAGNITVADAEFSVTGKEPSRFNLFTFGWQTINYISFILIALAILGTLIFSAWYIRVHFSAYRRQLNHRLGLTNAHVHKEFDNLKDALTEEMRNLEHAKSKRDLTREEERLMTRFRKLLDQSERAIEKDIEDLPR